MITTDVGTFEDDGTKLTTFKIDGIVHIVGNENCPACDLSVVSGPCNKCQDGLVHCQEINYFLDQYMLSCDRCG